MKCWVLWGQCAAAEPAKKRITFHFFKQTQSSLEAFCKKVLLTNTIFGECIFAIVYTVIHMVKNISYLIHQHAFSFLLASSSLTSFLGVYNRAEELPLPLCSSGNLWPTAYMSQREIVCVFVVPRGGKKQVAWRLKYWWMMINSCGWWKTEAGLNRRWVFSIIVLRFLFSRFKKLELSCRGARDFSLYSSQWRFRMLCGYPSNR